MHLVHDIDPGSSDAMNVIIEIPRGSANKYEVDKEVGLIKLDRVMHTAQHFPFDYGFVPQTLWHDGDPLDVIILTTYPIPPGILVEVRPVGLLNMNDSGEGDDKIIAVPTSDPRWNKVQDLKDVNEHTLREIEHFYVTYKLLQNKKVVVAGFKDAAAAKEAFVESLSLYKKSRK